MKSFSFCSFECRIHFKPNYKFHAAPAILFLDRANILLSAGSIPQKSLLKILKENDERSSKIDVTYSIKISMNPPPPSPIFQGKRVVWKLMSPWKSIEKQFGPGIISDSCSSAF